MHLPRSVGWLVSPSVSNVGVGVSGPSQSVLVPKCTWLTQLLSFATKFTIFVDCNIYPFLQDPWFLRLRIVISFDRLSAIVYPLAHRANTRRTR